MSFALKSEYMRRLSGFGQSQRGDCFHYRPSSVEQICDALAVARANGRKVCLRGAGRSYGDANFASESVSIDITRMNRILSWDPKTGVIDCEAGVSFEILWRHCLEDGYWPPVVTGTMYPTLGGALAMNVHGKNNFCQGTLGEHVIELEIILADGTSRVLTPNDELFYSVISGAGLLGIITRVKLKMHAVHSGYVRVYAEAANTWAEQIALFERFEKDSDYMVSWVDCFGKGSRLGRGQFHAAWYGERHDAATLDATQQDLPSLIMGFFPKSLVWKVLKFLCNRPGMRFINALKFFASRTIGNYKTHPQSLVAFSFLLDYVPDWRRAYEPGGLIQYQCFIPKAKTLEVFTKLTQLQQEAGLESYLGVMKRHRPDRFLLSHAVDGYSLALDFKITNRNRTRLTALAHAMNDVVLAAGGRFYFAKDSSLRPSDVEAYLGKETLGKFRDLKKELDPEGIFTSDLAVRTKLIN
jgi:decaprenylphospho-beta-D-ribofuranose 2-oxidase